MDTLSKYNKPKTEKNRHYKKRVEITNHRSLQMGTPHHGPKVSAQKRTDTNAGSWSSGNDNACPHQPPLTISYHAQVNPWWHLWWWKSTITTSQACLKPKTNLTEEKPKKKLSALSCRVLLWEMGCRAMRWMITLWCILRTTTASWGLDCGLSFRHSAVLMGSVTSTTHRTRTALPVWVWEICSELEHVWTSCGLDPILLEGPICLFWSPSTVIETLLRCHFAFAAVWGPRHCLQFRTKHVQPICPLSWWSPPQGQVTRSNRNSEPSPSFSHMNLLFIVLIKVSWWSEIWGTYSSIIGGLGFGSRCARFPISVLHVMNKVTNKLLFCL